MKIPQADEWALVMAILSMTAMVQINILIMLAIGYLAKRR